MRISDWSSDVCSSDLAAGVSILGPAVAAGFYELARRREQGLDSSWRHFFDVFSGPSFVPLVTLTVFLAVLFLLRSEEHTSELQSLMRISYAVFCLKKKKKHKQQRQVNVMTTQSEQE